MWRRRWRERGEVGKRGIKAAGRRASTTRPHAAAILLGMRATFGFFGFGWDKSLGSTDWSPPRAPSTRGQFQGPIKNDGPVS